MSEVSLEHRPQNSDKSVSTSRVCESEVMRPRTFCIKKTPVKVEDIYNVIHESYLEPVHGMVITEVVLFLCNTEVLDLRAVRFKSAENEAVFSEVFINFIDEVGGFDGTLRGLKAFLVSNYVSQH